jgi:hypothetical protein
LQYLLYAAYFAVGEADLDAVGMCRAISKNVFDDALGEFAGSLVLFEHYEDLCASFDVASGAAGRVHVHGLRSGSL